MITTLLALSLTPGALASSHREAPGIAGDPAADITDFYAFQSPEDPDMIVFLMNVLPLQAAYSGPNFHQFSDDVLYEIKIDNEGDGYEDIVFQFQTQTTIQFGETFLYNDGYVYNAPNTQIDGYEDINLAQHYTVTRVDDGVASTILAQGDVAPANVGTRSVVAGGYSPELTSPGSITTDHIFADGSYRFFAGPRQEGFYVDLAHTFDLLGVGVGPNYNSLAGFNVHTIAIEVPADMLTRDGNAPDAALENDVIAAWATTSRRAVTVRRPGGKHAARGPWVQVARLGNPLVNEAVIGLDDKDLFNASHPHDDAGLFLSYVTNPVLPIYMNAILSTYLPTSTDADLIPGVIDNGLDTGGREDLVLAYLTGYAGFCTAPGSYYFGGSIPGEAKTFYAYEALRLNLNGCSAWGGADVSYWPNGRFVSDDVVDVSLSAVAGYVLGLSGLVPDGVDASGINYLDVFPFLGDPQAGGTY